VDRCERAERIRRLQGQPPLLVLPNAWDVASGRRLAALRGCRGLATSSAAVARSVGFEHGEETPVEEMLRAVERVAGAVDVPVTAATSKQATAIRRRLPRARGLRGPSG
jgi:2-methylisocitrate lyase-like PEP mutase family enzyme